MPGSGCDPVISALFPAALERPEIADALGPPGLEATGKRATELRDQACADAARIRVTARAYEERYRAAQEEATRGRWPRPRIARPGLARVALRAAQAWMLIGLWGPGVYVALTATRSQWPERLVGVFVIGPLVLLLCGLAVGLVRWVLRRPARRSLWQALLAYNVLIPPSVVAEIVWDASAGSVAATLVTSAVTAVVGVAAVLVIVGREDPLDLAATADQVQVRELENAWRAVLLEEGLLPFLRQRLNERLKADRIATELSVSDAPGLRNLSDLSYHVPTAAGAELVRLTETMGNGTIALCGPRGVGKTLLLRAFCGGRCTEEHDPAQPVADLSLIVPAPVQYDRRDFMLHLYASLCRSVATYVERHGGKANDDGRHRRRTGRGRPRLGRSDRPVGLDDVAHDALVRFEQVRFLQTYSSEMTGQLGVHGVGLGGKRGVVLARQPLTYPEVVADLREFLTTAAATLRAHGERTGVTARLVIGIDELDRIQPAERARDFIDEIKVIFDIPNCLYLVSVSDEALHAASLASPGRRDAFDSAIDEVLRVGYLDLRTAVTLLDRRVVGLPMPFAALAHALSGGLARDLLRTARAMVETPTGRLPEVARDLVARDFTELVQATGAALATAGLDDPSFDVLRLLEDEAQVTPDSHRLHGVSERVGACATKTADDRNALLVTIALHIDHLAAVLSVFGDDLTAGRIESATRPGPASFDALARIRRTTGSDNALARRLLDEFRADRGRPG